MELDVRYMSAAVLARNPGLADVLKQANTKKSKYSNEKTYFEGHWFDSQKEANRYAELLLAKKAGIITEIELQPRFLLQKGRRCGQTNKWIRPIYYVADFKITYPDGSELVIDTKGFRTDVYKIKLKMFREKYPDVRFREE